MNKIILLNKIFIIINLKKGKLKKDKYMDRNASFKKSLLLSGSLLTLMTGCAVDVNPNNPLDIPQNTGVNDKISGNELENPSSLSNLNKFLGTDGNLNSNTYLSSSDIIKMENVGDEPPLILTTKKIDKMEMYNAKLGDMLRLILSGINVSLTVEPNVDLNTPVNVKIENKSIWAALKQVCEAAGYYIYYSAAQHSLIVTPYVTRKYYVPAEIFVKRRVSISFSSGKSTGGSIDPSFDINPPDPLTVLKNTLKMVGSQDKIVSIDPQAGVIYLKDRPNYIKEDDDAIRTFVKERSMQFEVQLIVAELNLNQMKQFGLDIADIAKDKMRISSLGGTQVNDSLIGDLIGQGGIVLSAWDNYANMGSTNPLRTSDLAFKMILASLKKMNNVEIVERPNIIVQNHSIGYIAVGDENSYVKSVKVIPGRQNPDGSYTAPTYEYDIGNYTDGLQFVVRVDKYLGKDRIGVALAPILAYTKVVPGPQQVQLLQRKIRQAMSVVSVRDGDIIVLGGMKSLKGTGEGDKSGLLPSIFGMKSVEKQKVETVFILRVKQIKHSYDTDKFITPATGDLINSVRVK